MSQPAADLVPVAARLRYTQLLRLGMVSVILGLAAAAPEVLGARLRTVLPATVIFVAIAAVVEGGWRLARRRSLLLFGALLISDGVYLAWVTYLSGGVYSPVRYLVLLHAAAVTLLASYRTGVKIAMWHSLLFFGFYNATRSGILERSRPAVTGLPTTDAQLLGVFVVVLWLLTIGIAVFSAANERELRRGKYDLEALNAMALALEQATDSRAVAKTLLDAVVDAFGFPRGLVVGGGDTAAQLLAEVNAEVGEEPAAVRVRPSTVLARAHERHAPVLVRGLDPVADESLAALLPGARNVMVLPLTADSRAVGALVVETAAEAGGRIERRVVAGAERFASYGSLALRNAGLLEQVQRMAATDGLTHIANRRTFESTLEREIARAARRDEPVSLVMLDIDHFKALNDTYGHQVGDDVLRNVAAALACECREFDTAARYGGEEFAIILPACSAEESFEIAERFRRIVSAAPSLVPITASAGVATFPNHAKGADNLVKVADEALYESKRNGRDRVTSAQLRMRTAALPPQAASYPAVG